MEEKWNIVIETFLDMEESWKDFQESLGEVESTAELTYLGQKIAGLATARAKFLVAVPRLIDWARRNGGLQNLMIEEPKEEA
jgi:hypothetical protein